MSTIVTPPDILSSGEDRTPPRRIVWILLALLVVIAVVAAGVILAAGSSPPAASERTRPRAPFGFSVRYSAESPVQSFAATMPGTFADGYRYYVTADNSKYPYSVLTILSLTPGAADNVATQPSGSINLRHALANTGMGMDVDYTEKVVHGVEVVQATQKPYNTWGTPPLSSCAWYDDGFMTIYGPYPTSEADVFVDVYLAARESGWYPGPPLT